MNKPLKAVIVGGGASGLMVALTLLTGKNRLSPTELVILEKNDRIGKKLSATGNGQCNITNTDISANNYYGSKEHISATVDKLKSIDLKEIFYSLGIPFTSEKGKVYPLSKQANSVVDAFRNFLDYSGVKVYTSTEVKAIEKKDVFKVVTANGEFYSQNVVLATGGKCGKQFGTDGKSYSLATNFGHTLTKLYPSIVQLKTDKEYIKGLKGHKEYVKVYAVSNGNTVGETEGDLLFTDYGVSGNAIFSISSKVKENDLLKISFLPDKTESEISDILENKSKLGFVKKEDILSGIINRKIGESIVKRSDGSISSIVKTLKDYRLKVIGTAGFDNAQVTKGGIDGNEIDPVTMQSKKVKGLYLTGEIIDVDGDCGGYNLTFAFVSAISSANAIKGI